MNYLIIPDQIKAEPKFFDSVNDAYDAAEKWSNELISSKVHIYEKYETPQDEIAFRHLTFV